MTVNTFVTIGDYKYAVVQGSYIRKWVRQFTAQLVANIVELNWVDRGPGIKTSNMSLLLADWDPSSAPYQAGITQSLATQKANLEASYLAINSSLRFIDPFGESPALGGVYFTNVNMTIPNWSTPQKPYIQMDVELIESKKAIS
jgi:hypothetical protein